MTAALVVLIMVSRAPAMRESEKGSLFGRPGAGTVFLFDGPELIDASPEGRALLADAADGEDNWRRLLGRIAPHFPSFESRIAELPKLGRFTLVSDGPRPLTLRAEWRGGLTRISLYDPHSDGAQAVALDPVTERARQDEFSALRLTMDSAPVLIWREDADGAVVWANRRYLDLAHGTSGEELPWPLPKLFTTLDLADALSGPTLMRRASVTLPGAAGPLWFDCQARADGADRIVFALPADGAVQAETSLRSFIQTLTKTFAHLTVGLAIFDRQRQLVLFNPALIELTHLSPEFLSSRPRLNAVLDAMREKRMIPEPKDYKSWRGQMAALERAAASGQYEETWTLPSGLTYRITGRPHPDGAVAFLFEDISAEMTRTRRFRAEMELSQAVIDTFEMAVAVFSPAGKMLLSNRAYRRLWSQPAEESPVEIGFDEALGHWQARSAPSPLWDQLKAFMSAVGERSPWSGDLRLADGRALTGHFLPMPGGVTLIRFSFSDVSEASEDALRSGGGDASKSQASRPAGRRRGTRG